MKALTDFIFEKILINKNTVINKVENKVDMNLKDSFTKNDVDKIIDFINTEMPVDIRPVVITNVKKNESVVFSNYELYLFYDDDYENKSIYDLTYIRFFMNSIDGASVNIYDHKEQRYYGSIDYKRDDYLDACLEYVRSKFDLLKSIL